jgi:hypothetical protein
MVSDAEVCLMKMCSRPMRIFFNSGNASKIGRVIEWHPFGKDGNWISRCSQATEAPSSNVIKRVNGILSKFSQMKEPSSF